MCVCVCVSVSDSVCISAHLCHEDGVSDEERVVLASGVFSQGVSETRETQIDIEDHPSPEGQLTLGTQ